MWAMISGTSSNCGRGRTSGEPRRTHHFLAHSLPPPAVAVGRAARRGNGDRPTVFANATLASAPPRPGPASLLTSSPHPQPGCATQRGGRVGTASRAAGMTGNRKTTVGLGYTRVGTLDVAAMVTQVVNVEALAAVHPGSWASALAYILTQFPVRLFPPRDPHNQQEGGKQHTEVGKRAAHVTASCPAAAPDARVGTGLPSPAQAGHGAGPSSYGSFLISPACHRYPGAPPPTV